MKGIVRTFLFNVIPLLLLLILILLFINGTFSRLLSSGQNLYTNGLHLTIIQNEMGHLVSEAWKIIQPAHSIFLAILFEALPFILVGAFLSSVLHVLIPEEKMVRLIPKNKVLSVIVGSLIGFIVPVCDCGTIPVARTMLKKGVPLSAVSSFVLAAPVINPITLIATYFAFGMNGHIVLLRFLCTFSVAVLVGWLVGGRRKAVVTRLVANLDSQLEVAATDQTKEKKRKPAKVLKSIIEHTVEEFFGIIGFLILSAAIASVYQVYHIQHGQALHAQHGVVSVLLLMGLAILFSLCSMADAFVARSFATIYPIGAVIAFMVIGQMVDLRNLFLLPKTFGMKIAVNIIGLCLGLCLIIGLVI